MGPACSVASFVAATQIAPYENHLRRLHDVIVFLRLVDSADSGQFMFEVTKRRVKAKALAFIKTAQIYSSQGKQSSKYF